MKKIVEKVLVKNLI
ncbi:unnamed protein product [Medioppia subpectinata]|uniref:Uncharacterized protein n=1 Tax=Medioppia subpectinata TaxID=1979941 RepID=A0A7R9Q3I3_9ACAR|nr:unnamed protein product [Medioppia subpectinata]CAG2110575.1 unnamed protein product [Medioppia subpectinata]